MMGRQDRDQGQLFYEFSLDEMIPTDHLLRRINVFATAVVAWHLGVRLRDCSRRWAFWLETEAGPSLKLAVNVRLDLRIPFRARPRFR